jgi:hypothetical protein
MKILTLVLALASSPPIPSTPQDQPQPDVSKRAVEVPIKFALAPPAADAPLVGHVRWHASADAALAAAGTSGRPVLLFQLLGALDDELC